MSKYKLNFNDEFNISAEGETMLEALNTANIFDIKKNGSSFKIIEQCDCNYEATVTKDQLKDLANELLVLADS